MSRIEFQEEHIVEYSAIPDCQLFVETEFCERPLCRALAMLSRSAKEGLLNYKQKRQGDSIFLTLARNHLASSCIRLTKRTRVFTPNFA